MRARRNVWLALPWLASAVAAGAQEGDRSVGSGGVLGAANEASARWQVQQDQAGTIRWQMPDVDAADQAVQSELVVDHRPPAIDWSWDGAHVRGSGEEVVLRAATTATIAVSDPSGASIVAYRWSGGGESAAGFPGTLPPATEFLEVEAADRFGNTGTRRIPVSVDEQGPNIAAELLTWIDGAEGYSTRPARLQLSSQDEQVSSELILPGGARCSRSCEVTVEEDRINLLAVDALGNETQRLVSWSYDTEAPTVSVLFGGASYAPGSLIGLRVDETVGFDVRDAGVGGASASYHYNDEVTKPVPESLRFLNRGRYVLFVVATDRLGNTANYRWTVVAR